jgi:hypothetical protein
VAGQLSGTVSWALAGTACAARSLPPMAGIPPLGYRQGLVKPLIGSRMREVAGAPGGSLYMLLNVLAGMNGFRRRVW